jgi:triosephosphate isomerase (TIM)
MTELNKILVIANWKMNPQSFDDADKLFTAVRKIATPLRNVQTIICPPFVFISELYQSYSGSKVLFGAQDVFGELMGSFTGEISVGQLKDIGVEFVIVGHSERRTLGETNKEVNKKVRAVLKEGLQVILCIGERERDGHGEYLQLLKQQIDSAFQDVKNGELGKIIVAYEPIWAIGKTDEDAITPQKLHEMVLYIRKILVDHYNKEMALSVPIIYGGSVERENAEVLLKHGEADGFLVGHASLDANEFGDILKIANSSVR